MGDRTTDGQYDQPGDSPGNHPPAAVTTKAKGQCQDADWDDEDQQFCMQMVVAELTEKRQERDRKWQQQAVQQAQA